MRDPPRTGHLGGERFGRAELRELRKNRGKPPKFGLQGSGLGVSSARVRSHPEYRDDGTHGRVPSRSGKEAEDATETSLAFIS